jgi:hypothetical protein
MIHEPGQNGMVPLRRARSHAGTTWVPYYDALHPPGKVHMTIA